MKDQRQAIPPDAVITEATSIAGTMSTGHHGIEVAVEFKPVEHPTEPFDVDQPVQCPMPEPSILNVSVHHTCFLAFAYLSICCSMEPQVLEVFRITDFRNMLNFLESQSCVSLTKLGLSNGSCLYGDALTG